MTDIYNMFRQTGRDIGDFRRRKEAKEEKRIDRLSEVEKDIRRMGVELEEEEKISSHRNKAAEYLRAGDIRNASAELTMAGDVKESVGLAKLSFKKPKPEKKSFDDILDEKVDFGKGLIDAAMAPLNAKLEEAQLAMAEGRGEDANRLMSEWTEMHSVMNDGKDGEPSLKETITKLQEDLDSEHAIMLSRYVSESFRENVPNPKKVELFSNAIQEGIDTFSGLDKETLDAAYDVEKNFGVNVPRGQMPSDQDLMKVYYGGLRDGRLDQAVAKNLLDMKDSNKLKAIASDSDLEDDHPVRILATLLVVRKEYLDRLAKVASRKIGSSGDLRGIVAESEVISDVVSGEKRKRTSGIGRSRLFGGTR